MKKVQFVFLIISCVFLSRIRAQNIVINEICASNYICYEDSNENHGDWIELYNAGNFSVNVGGMYLTDDLSDLDEYLIPNTNPSATTIPSHAHIIFWFDDKSYEGVTHLPGKLSGNGEQVGLTLSDGVTLLDSVTYPAQTYDVTYGRTSDASPNWSFFPVPTPDDDNIGGGYTGIAGKVNYSQDAGFYSSSIQVSLTTNDTAATIYYSLNGNEPSPTNGLLYTGPITVDTNAVIRARIFKQNFIPGEVTTRSFFVNRIHDLPVLSIVTDSANLWDEYTGIYCFGVDNYSHSYSYTGANFWEDWKRPAHIELFEANDVEVVSQNINLSISGNTTRALAQKSFNFESKDALGKNSIPYQLFPQLPIGEYKSFKVRNSGSDWSSTGMRDALNHTIIEGVMDLDHQTNRPVIIYLNGQYWGRMDMTEKLDEDYLNEHFNYVDKDSVDIINSNIDVVKGDAVDYNNMLDFIDNNTMAVQANYQYIKTQMDVDNYINYEETRIYYAATDWPNNNIKYWRPKDHSHPWRWILWDTDRSTLLSASHNTAVDHNTLSWATTSGSIPDWAQYLLNNLLLNSEFKGKFITQFAHNMNFIFCPMRVDSIVDFFRDRLLLEEPAHIQRWEHTNDTIHYYTEGYRHSVAEWNTEIDTIRFFFNNRARYVREDIMNKFGINDTSQLSVNKMPPDGGIVMVDTFLIPENACKLVYFDGYPVTLTALANPGYVFSGWTTAGGDTLPITWTPNGDTTITAYFTPAPAQEPSLASHNIVSTVANCTDVVLTWVNGNGAKRIVIAKTSSAVNAFPADGNVYPADATFGNGTDLGAGNFVVYSGNSNTCSIAGLLSGTQYYFAVIEYNGNAVTSNYNITTYASADISLQAFSVTINAAATAICEGSSTELSASGGVIFYWSPAAGLSSVTDSMVTATLTSPETYILEATDINGCISTDTISISVNSLPAVTLIAQPGACVSASPVLLSGGNPSGGIYGGNYVTTGMFDPVLAGTGMHDISYLYSDANGCADSATASIEVFELPFVEIVMQNDICEDAMPVTLSGGIPSGGIYIGTGVSNGNFDPSITGQGIQIISYAYTDSLGCTNSDTSTIFVSGLPVVSLGTDTTICMYSNIFLDAGAGYASYLWSTGATTQSVFVDTSGAGIGTAVFVVTVTNLSNCAADDSINITFDICAGILPGLIQSSAVSVYPNPFNNELHITAGENHTVIELYDLYGNTILRKAIGTAPETIKPQVSAGIYFLRIETGRTNTTIKVVKTN
ncbi:hypothetical protein BH11BAC1_BH11BAC1_22240 [soil metagenome]